LADRDGKLGKLIKTLDVAKSFAVQAEMSRRFDETDYIYHVQEKELKSLGPTRLSIAEQSRFSSVPPLKRRSLWVPDHSFMESTPGKSLNAPPILASSFGARQRSLEGQANTRVSNRRGTVDTAIMISERSIRDSIMSIRPQEKAEDFSQIATPEGALLLDPEQVTKQMLLTYKVNRRRNNNVIPITLTRALPYNATQKQVQVSPLRSVIESQQTSRITE
jgi:hypothetical protein